MKIILFILLITFSTFSQNCKKLEFTIAEIDSLSRSESYLKNFDWGGRVESEKKTNNTNKENYIVKGTGYIAIEPYYYFLDFEYYNKLSTKQKRFYNDSKCYKLLKVNYEEKIVYEDGTYDYLKVYFYYDNEELFFIKIEEKIKDLNIEEKKIYMEEYISNLNNKTINEFNFCNNINNWIKEQNKDIIEKCINKN